MCERCCGGGESRRTDVIAALQRVSLDREVDGLAASGGNIDVARMEVGAAASARGRGGWRRGLMGLRAAV